MSQLSGIGAPSSARIPTGVLGLDYLKFLQLTVHGKIIREGRFDQAHLEEAMRAIGSETMRAARPAMKVFFDGCRFWLASHFHRYKAARHLTPPWCQASGILVSDSTGIERRRLATCDQAHQLISTPNEKPASDAAERSTSRSSRLTSRANLPWAARAILHAITSTSPIRHHFSSTVLVPSLGWTLTIALA
ncbi:hypothetical protein [Paraburkholderia sp. Ac-20347]|uniref:hypothetical protein n=1 Tax=Paraburkholderia sp. Ac-20347 TaxID=2703892 RepID=UPI00197F2F0D|nr:hypothetical protein [Paraburkholderia sp. Ac-20347]MBN3812859.1 hypothetical protein [Paraburkholderia sp. Ac-20347]